jgi:hypothetical protein
MTPHSPGQLPMLALSDFGPGLDHVIDVHDNGKVIALLHKDDPVRLILPNLQFPDDDPFTYAFIHGGQSRTRFENAEVGTHEIPVAVVARILTNQFGSQLLGMSIRMCTCYGNLLRPGDPRTLVQSLAGLLPNTAFEGYHGLVRVLAQPPEVRLGMSIQWDSTAVPPGPVITGPPGNWEPVTP